MDLVKYIIVGVVCLVTGIVIMILARNIVAGLGFTFISFFIYLMWNYLKVLNGNPPSEPGSVDN